MNLKHRLACGLLPLAALIAAPSALAGASDLQYLPADSSGHDFNHAPIGESFMALASAVKAGVYLADETSFTNWLATRYPGQIQPGSYPYAVAPSLKVNVKLLDGEGPGGVVLDSRDLTLTAPFMGFVDVDYAAAGVLLNVGRMYTLLLTDISGQAYPNGVTGWVVPSVHAADSAAGAYANGLPILQNAVAFNDSGIGDNSFEVIDLVANGSLPPPPPPAGCTGANVVIGTVGSSYLTIAGSTGVSGRIWYAPASGTTFTGGATGFVAGALISYSGSLNPSSGCYATSMTVTPAPTPVTLNGTLPGGVVGSIYAATLTASGGTAPYAWSATGLPAGLAFASGSFSGTPTVAGTSNVVVTVGDARGKSSSTSYAVTIAAAANACSKPSSLKLTSGSGTITAVTGSSITIGLQKIALNACTQVRYKNKDSALKVGQSIDWSGWPVGGVMTAKDINVLR